MMLSATIIRFLLLAASINSAALAAATNATMTGIESSSSSSVACPAECCSSATAAAKKEDPLLIRILLVNGIYPTIYNMVNFNVQDYNEQTGANVEIDLVPSETYQDFYREILSDAKNGGGLFDGYLMDSAPMGEVGDTFGGLVDLTPYINADRNIDWTDVLSPFRQWVGSYGEKTYMMPLDGDMFSLYYSKDALKHFGLNVPRTWDEYLAVAKAVHGKEFNGKTLNGNCFATGGGGLIHFSIQLIMASMTQSQGTSTGSLFDTEDMNPLLGEAFTETVKFMEEVLQYSSDDVFDPNPYVPLANLNNGECMLTYFWGDQMKLSGQGSYLKQNGQLGVGRTPGSTKVLDRETGRLVDCTAELCQYGEYYQDIGWVNYSPYIANGGHGLAISANTTPEKQNAMADFLMFAGSKAQTDKYTIQNATANPSIYTAQDPTRKSHLVPDKWIAQGYDEELSKEYTQSLMKTALSKNLVVDIRFAKSSDIYGILSEQVLNHLNSYTGKSEEELAAERIRIGNVIAEQWTKTISTYDQLGDTIKPILETYQVERGVYVPNELKNQINNIIPVGFALMCIILACSLGFAVWTFMHRESRVIKASQPPFLYLICLGCMIMSLTIVPLSIDDSMVSAEGCSKACASVPWLIAIGFSVAFSALGSKIWRLNRLMKAASGFKRITIKVKDVMVPFFTLLGINIVLLLVWTVVDPLRWVRTVTGRDSDGSIESVGACVTNGSAVSKAMSSLLFIVNLLALGLALIQAYKARGISIEYSESHYVAMSMGFILEAFLIGIPLIFLSSGNPVTSYFVKTVVIFFVSMSLLLWIFAPKIYYARNPQNSDSANISSPYGSTGSQAGASSSMYTGPTSHELNKLGEDSNTFSRSGHDGVSPSSSNVAERVLEVETGQPTDV